MNCQAEKNQWIFYLTKGIKYKFLLYIILRKIKKYEYHLRMRKKIQNLKNVWECDIQICVIEYTNLSEMMIL